MHMPAFPARGLYAITDGPRADLIDACAAAMEGGAAVLQYRDKSSDHTRRRDEARATLRCCARRHGVPLIVNDDIELAAEIGAAGVHLGEDDTHLATARARLGRNAIIGVSCYDSLDRARELAARRRLSRLRRILPIADQTTGTPRHAGSVARRARIRQAAGGDRRHYAGQCIVADRGRRRFRRRDFRRIRPRQHDLQRRAVTPSFSLSRYPHVHESRTLPTRAAPIARRRQFARARLPLGRRRTVLYRPRRRRVSMGCRGQALHRLRRLVGADDRRPQSSEGAHGGGTRGARRACPSAHLARPK